MASSPFPPSSLCVVGQTESFNNLTGVCKCYAAYEGPHCEITKSYWVPAFWGHVILFAVLFTVLLLWSLLKLSELLMKRRFRISKLSNLVLIFLIIAIILKILSLFLGRLTLLRYGLGTTATTLSVAIIRILPVALWMASSALILGFWFDVLKSNLSPKIGRRTRIVCIIGAALLILQIPGFLFAGFGQAVAGLLFTVIPYIIDVIGLIALTIVISCKSNKNLSEHNYNKKAFALRWLIAIDAVWVIYAFIVFFSGNTFEGSTWFFNYFQSLCEFFFTVILLVLVDRYGGPIKLFKFVILREDNKRDKKETTSKDTPSEDLTTSKEHTTKTSSKVNSSNELSTNEVPESKTKTSSSVSSASSTSESVHRSSGETTK